MDYLLFADRAEAERLTSKINDWLLARTGQRWGALIEHPSELKYAVPIDERVRGALPENLVKGAVSEAEATRVGFYFSPLHGRFYKPLHKCEEAEILWGALNSGYGKLPFPVARCLFMGSLGALYSAEQHLKVILSGPAARALLGYSAIDAWWRKRRDEIHRQGELLHFLRSLNNSEKHGASNVPTGLRPTARLINSDGSQLTFSGTEFMGNPLGFRMSAEGPFRAESFAVGYERWIESDEASLHAFVTCKDAFFAFELLGAPSRHCGSLHQAKTPPEFLRLAIDYHFQLVRDAVLEWDKAVGSSSHLV
jgi:hypothetical protein